MLLHKIITRPKNIIKNISNLTKLYNILKTIKIEEKYINNVLYTNIELPTNILLNIGNLIITTQDCTIQTNVENNCKLYLNPLESKDIIKWTDTKPSSVSIIKL